MFSYYGSKSKIIGRYPEPVFDHIIEPFAGSARYALKYWDRQVTLVDKYKVICDVWNYLISASVKDIESLPDMSKGDKVEDHKHLTDAERYLIGFCINRGNPLPVRTANNYNSWNKDKIKIASSLYKIRHWKVIHGSYESCTGESNVTYFVDPPYVDKGYKYKHSIIDYEQLRKWCLNAGVNNQVIVCENTGADWLNFKTLVDIKGIRSTDSTEVMWTNYE